MQTANDRNGGASPLEGAAARVQGAVSAVDAAFIGSARVIRAFFIALVAREHLLLLGPPGTAKSEITKALAATLKHRLWTYLLTKGTTPNALVGGLDLANFKATGEERRNPAGTMREAFIIFLDEVFKGSDFILNSLLTALNEREYHELGNVERLPLEVCIGASNELPGGATDRIDPTLDALYERFSLKFWIEDLSPANQDRLIDGFIDGTVGHVATHDPVTTDDVAVLRDHAKALPWSNAARVAMRTIRRDVGDVLRISGRTLGKCVRIARAAAALDGAPEVLPEHLSILADVLWRLPDERAPVRLAVMRAACPDYEAATKLLDAAHAAAEPALMHLPALTDGSASMSDVQQVIDAQKKVATCGSEMISLIGSAIEPMRVEAREVWAELGDALAAYKRRAASKIVAQEAF